MGQAANDNEELSFITLLAATKNVTRYLKTNEVSVDLTRSSFVSNSSGVGATERPEICLTEKGTPSFAVAAKLDSLEPGLVIPMFGAVSLVLRPRDLTQVAEPIVLPVSINVVDYINGPSAVNV